MEEVIFPKKLFKPQILLLISVIVALLLVVLFPWKTAHYLNSYEASVLKEQFSSTLKTKYYQILSKNKTPVPEVLLLAQNLANKGLWIFSRNLLSNKLAVNQLDNDQLKDYELVALNNNIGLFFESKNDKEKKKLKQSIRQQLLTITRFNNLSSTTLLHLARYSTTFELYPQASELYKKLADRNLPLKPQWFAQAGKLAIQSGDDVTAAKLFKNALESTKAVKNLNLYTKNWLSALIRAGQFSTIKEFLDVVKDNPNKYWYSLEAIAKVSAESGYPAISSYLFQYLGGHDKHSKQQSRWYEKASHWAAVTENYEDAITFLLKAKKVTTDENNLWSIKYRLVDLYIKDDNADAALAIVLDTLQDSPDDVRLINKAVEISLVSGKPEIARKINLAYLEQHPDSIDTLLRQARIESATNKYSKAINYIQQAIKISPDNLDSQIVWADIEESHKKYDLALERWIWIYAQDDNKRYRQRLINIAQANIDGKGLDILQKLSETGELPRQAVFDVFYHLVDKKEEKSALNFLQSYLSTHKPDKELYITLAKWQSSLKQYTASLATWKKLEKHYGNSRLASLSQLELLWLLRKKKTAYRLWLKNRASWGKKVDTKYLSIMAEIAWQHKYRKSALSYYSTLLKRKYKRSRRTLAFQYMRISELQSKLGRENLALSTLRKGFLRTGDSQLLIGGLQRSFDFYDDASFTGFASLAKTRRTNITKKSRYWVLLGAYNQRNGRLSSSLKYYKRALAINPNSRDAKIGINAIRKAGKS